MEKHLLDKKFIPTDGNEKFSYIWERGPWLVYFDTGSQADLYIKNWKDERLHVCGIYGFENSEYPHLGLKNVFEKYGI